MEFFRRKLPEPMHLAGRRNADSTDVWRHVKDRRNVVIHQGD